MPDWEELGECQSDAGGVSFDQDPVVSAACRNGRPSFAHFGNARAEYDAARDASALFDLSDRVQVELRGKDACQFLNNFCTNDIKQVRIGGGCEAFITNVRGRVIGHVFVFLTQDGLVLDSAPTDEEALINHLDRYLFAEAVQLIPHSGEYGELYLSGSDSQDVLAKLGIAATSFEMFDHDLIARERASMVVRRVDFWDAPGFLLSGRREDLADLWQRAASSGARPAGAQAFHARRIEAGFPWIGVDVGPDHLAPEVGRNQQAISYTKGCYLGQEPIARIDALGHINRQLVRLRGAANLCSHEGASLCGTDEKEVGTIRSVTRLPETQEAVALGIVRSSHARPGSTMRLSGVSESDQVQAF